MNTPTHLAAGALVAQVAILAAGPSTTRATRVGIGLGCVTAAALFHLALDAIPHYNWIVYLTWFHGLPFDWLIREGVLALPILAVALYCGRNYPAITWLGLAGGLYPDLEKVAYVDFHIPKQLVIFRGHSLHLSSHAGGLAHATLITLELLILAVLLVATIALRRRRSAVNNSREFACIRG